MTGYNGGYDEAGGERVPTLDLGAIHKLLLNHAVSDDLVVVRLSSRAKRLIFKSSVKKG